MYKMNLYCHQDRKCSSLNLCILKENLHVLRVYMFSILATALLFHIQVLEKRFSQFSNKKKYMLFICNIFVYNFIETLTEAIINFEQPTPVFQM